MSEIQIFKKDGTNFIAPEANIGNIRRILGEDIKKIVALNKNPTTKVNRQSLEAVIKRELGFTDEQVKKKSDTELLELLKNPPKKEEIKAEIPKVKLTRNRKKNKPNVRKETNK